jgi:uncharacterized protein (TIGR02266 family)
MSVPISDRTPYDAEARAGRSGRIPLEVPVQLRMHAGSHAGVTRNISGGGLFVATMRSLPVGDRVTVMLTIPGDDEPVEALAEVRWSRPFQDLDDRPPGLGLRFIDTPLRAAILVRELQLLRPGRPDSF